MKIVNSIKESLKKNSSIDVVARSLYKRIPVMQREQLSRMTNNPYSRLEDENKFIFIHIPKCGGNAVIGSLFGVKATGHIPIRSYRKWSKSKYNEYRKVAIVRHPVDRFVSAFEYLKRGGMGLYDQEFHEKYLKNIKDPTEMALALKDVKYKKQMLKWTHFIEQEYFLTIDGDLCVDNLYKQEYLGESFPEICKILKPGQQSIDLKKINATGRMKKQISSQEALDVLYSVYRNDFSLLNYE